MPSAKELAWTYFELLNQGQVEEALELLSDGGTHWNIRTRDLERFPDAKPWMRKVLADVPMRFALHKAYEDGDHAILELESNAIRPDGEVYNNFYCFIITVLNGKIVHLREYQDTGYANEMIASLPS